MKTRNGVENKSFDFELDEKDSDSRASRRNGTHFPPNKNPEWKVEEEENDDQCGLGCYRPKWAQRFATKKCFIAVFSLLGVVQGMSWSYFTATISTLEKRFKISSETAGIVMTGGEVSQIIFSLILSHYGGAGHRPRWIAVGTFLSAIACFVLASPQVFYGSGPDALSLTEEYSDLNGVTSQLSLGKELEWNSTQGKSSVRETSTGWTQAKVSLCQRSDAPSSENCADQDTDLAPLALLFLSQFISGIGVLLFFTLGGPYLDDNTKRKNIAMMFGIMMSLRLVGPTIGFLLASGALKMYVNPLLTPIITPKDPRWIGAWWLGWVIFGTIMIVFSIVIALFPQNLKKGTNDTSNSGEDGIETVPKFSEIPKAVKMLLKNKVNVLNNLAGVFYLFAAIGYFTYMPKYMETIFLQTASKASVITGAVGIFTQASGLVLSGYLISRFQFSARKLAAWNVVTGFAHVFVILALTQIGCDVGKLSFGAENKDGTWNLTSACNQACNCKISKLFPVCYQEENTVFYSACHAGCETYENSVIGNCSCIPEAGATVTLGNCSTGCSQIFIMFLGILALIKFVDATGRIGNVLISYRCVKIEERSLSIGLNILLISALALLPAPIVFGKIIDGGCLVWGGMECGKRGNCMLYDGEELRYVFNIFASGFIFIGVIFDCCVCYFVKDLNLYKE